MFVFSTTTPEAVSYVITFYDWLLMMSAILFCLSFVPAYFFLNRFYKNIDIV